MALRVHGAYRVYGAAPPLSSEPTLARAPGGRRTPPTCTWGDLTCTPEGTTRQRVSTRQHAAQWGPVAAASPALCGWLDSGRILRGRTTCASLGGNGSLPEPHTQRECPASTVRYRTCMWHLEPNTVPGLLCALPGQAHCMPRRGCMRTACSDVARASTVQWCSKCHWHALCVLQTAHWMPLL